MSRSNTYSEPLPELAVETFDVAARQCASCRDTHTLWPYIRLSRTSIGAEREGSRLEPLLAEASTGTTCDSYCRRGGHWPSCASCSRNLQRRRDYRVGSMRHSAGNVP